MKRSNSDQRIDAIATNESAKYATVGKRGIPRVLRNALSEVCEGAIRVYLPQGDRSLVVPMSLQTTSQQVADKFKVDALYLQIGNLHIKPLPSESRPLVVQSDVLCSLGYGREEERVNVGPQPHLRHIYAFFLGRPELQCSARLNNEILVATCNVRKGRLMHRWLTRKCIMYNGTLRVEHENEEDEVFMVNRYKIDVTETRRGRALRLSDPNGSTCFHFDSQDTLNLWLTRCQQVEMAPNCDLSDQRLVLLPDQLFTLSHTRSITQLNLRRNSLQMRSSQVPSRGPLIGWLDDVARLSSLNSLDIGDNRLGSFPLAVCQLTALTRLILPSNQMQSVPVNIRLLVNLTQLDLSNNWISTLPIQLSECTRLTNLNLSFNRIEAIPEVLPLLENVRCWQLAGNQIQSLHSANLERVVKLDLRRNTLESSFRLPSGGQCLSWLDIRDNERVQAVYLTGYPTLQHLHCERLQLTSLHLNGSNLISLHAAHNLLENVVVMPIPYRLTTLDVSHNLMRTLPSWIADLPHIDSINVSNNQLNSLPDRIFVTPSLRSLIVRHNILVELPAEVENCHIETLDVHSNRLQQLPNTLFKSAHRLRNVNVSDNQLRSLPPANPLPDLNRIQALRAGMNDLDEAVISVVIQMRKLKILDLQENNIRFFDDSALCMLTQLEELNLSSNRLSSLSHSLPALPSLQVLRVHSNTLTNVPDLSHSITLQVVDISNNKLVHVSTAHCVSPRLKQLDLTCNSALNITRLNSTPVNDRKTVSMVDIGEKSSMGRFQVGFSETNGQRNKLCIRQLRPISRFLSPLFALVDGGGNADMGREIVERIERFAETEEVCDSDTLKGWILRTHEWLGEAGERIGAGALLVSISHGKIHCASVGSSRAAVFTDGKLRPLLPLNHWRDEEEYERLRNTNATVDEDNLINGVAQSSRQIGFSFLFPSVIPNAYTNSHQISPSDDCIVLASRAVWDHLTEKVIERILISTTNPQVAAKKIQDAVQSCDWTGNTSVMVVRLASQSHSALSLNRSDSWQSSKRPEISELTLQKIEERLEKISEVISKIEDESSSDEPRGKSISARQPRRTPSVSRSTMFSHPSVNSLEGSIRHAPTTEYSVDGSPRQAPPPDPPPTGRRKSVDNEEIRDRWLSLGRASDSRARFEMARNTLHEVFKLQIPQSTQMHTIDL